MKKVAKVEGHLNLIRDLSTNAIINTDSIESMNYDHNKQRRLDVHNDMVKMKSDIDNLNMTIQEIKIFLKEILNESR